MSEPTQICLTTFARRLVADGQLSETAVTAMMIEAAEKQTPFITHLIKQKSIPPAQLAQIIAQEFGLPLFNLQQFNPKTAPLKMISEQIIRQHLVLPLAQKGQQLILAIADPTHQIILDEIAFHTRLIPRCIVAATDQLEQLIAQILSASELNKLEIFSALQLEEIIIPTETEEEQIITVNEIDDQPIVRFVQNILLDAIHRKASDIHFEPYEKHLRIRFRIDGILAEMATAPIHLAQRIIARIKIMAHLDISERRLPQDGRFKIMQATKPIANIRVSTCPTLNGEKVVIRILDLNNTRYDIDALGLETPQKTILLQVLQKPQGMIIVTGPTGSGKSLTLYTALNFLNTNGVNILTVEDPIEIQMRGINQVAINPKIGLGFATVLRTFLRQDPDIIMVGEMRDQETAEIGIQAAQTGHLVLSTLHTNSALEALTRLMNMGIARYNIVTSLTLIVAQRLARRLCVRCKQPYNLSGAALQQQGFLNSQSLTLFRAQGCEHCQDGYKGRIGIFECIEVSEDIKEFLSQEENWLSNAKSLVTNNINLWQSGLHKVKAGITSLAEIRRVLSS